MATHGVTQGPDSNARNQLAEIGAQLAARPYARRGVAPSDTAIRVLLVDDHALLREGVHLMLRSAPDITVVGESENGIAAVAKAEQTQADVIVMDLDMPGGDGLSSVLELRKRLPHVRVLILTVHAEHEKLLPLLEAGARGYLTKESASRELVDGIRVVAAGDIYVRPTAARLLAQAIVPHAAEETALSRLKTLSTREQTIVRLLSQGFSGAETARQLGISNKTVDAYKRRIEDKLGLHHRTDYVKFAIEAGILGR
ncbi:MAG: response regulator receiver [Gemmatimonadetes bacterium]|nr:response regulator receiver [Gemmatimonadota bacterium]